MKRKLFILLLCLVLAISATFVSCDKTPALSPMSEVRLDDHVLSWDVVDNALFYSVRVTYDRGGYEVPVAGTSYSLALFDKGDYTLQVRARLEDGYTAYCEPIDYTLAEDIQTTPGEDETVTLRGSGTYDDPILIFDKTELAAIPVGLREETVEGQTISYVNYFRLMNDIDLSGQEWVSIGSSSAPFRGYFDGNGHKIYNMTQTKLGGTTYRYAGLFGNTQDAVILNLQVDVDIRLGTNTQGFYLGGLIGESKNTIVENCTVGGQILVNSEQHTTQSAYVGMMVGQSWGTQFVRCTTYGKVDVTFARVYAGGIAGLTRNTRNEYLTHCLSTVDVHTKGTGMDTNTANTPHGTSFATGMAYISNTTEIRDCVWLGKTVAETITGTESQYYGAGMFANTAKVTESTKVCNLTFTDCYFADDCLSNIDRTAYPTLAEVANRYLVAGAEGQKRGTYAYCVAASEKAVADAYTTLDFENTWTIRDGALALKPVSARWVNVTYMLGDTVYMTDRVLVGHTLETPTEPEGVRGWDYDNQPVQSDVTIHAVLTQN